MPSRLSPVDRIALLFIYLCAFSDGSIRFIWIIQKSERESAYEEDYNSRYETVN